MTNHKILFLFLLSYAYTGMNEQAFGQTKSIPQPVTNHFTSMFPGAKNIEWRDKITNYQVFFFADNSKCEAKFSTDGKWISSEKQIAIDSIPKKIKDSIRLGTYADWKIQSAYMLHFPDQPDQYHIVVTKDEFPKKILFFSITGQILKDNLSL